MTTMTPNRPYLLRATFEWICDNNLTPHIAVDAHYEGVEVPQQYVKDGQIVLNIAPRAVSHFSASNDEVSFSARFGGMPTQIRVPINAVMAIFARENGQGMAFDPIEPPETPPPSPSSGKGDKAKSGPTLKVVK